MEATIDSEAIFLCAVEGILITEATGTIIRINPSAEKMFGYKEQELTGKKIDVLIPASYLKDHGQHKGEKISEDSPGSKVIKSDVLVRKKNGAEFPVHISQSSYSNVLGNFKLLFITDRTERWLAEEQLRAHSENLEHIVKNRTSVLNEAMSELEKTDKILKQALEKEKNLHDFKSRFVTMALHEFRTPLATLMSSLSLIKKYSDLNEGEKRDKHINCSKSSIMLLTDILNDFLSVSELEEGKVVCQPETFNLPLFIEEILDRLNGTVKGANRISHLHTGKTEVFLDKLLLENILIKFISNALKFSPETEPVWVLSDFSDSTLKISVKDNGTGIPKEEYEHLFGSFFRGRNASYVQGLGLGLNIASRYAQLMNGSISFESKEKKGTTFSVTFKK